MTPYFSVIIPLYNKENYISETLNSVLSQTFSNFEIIIINDGSTDLSASIVSDFNDSRILLYTIENSGVSMARNYGVTKANSNLIAFLDADDLWLPHHLEDLKLLYEEFPKCGLYAKAYVSRQNENDIKSHYNGITNNTHWKGVLTDYFNSSMHNSIAHTSSVVIPKYIFLKANGFNEYYTSGEDIDLWIRLALKHPVAFNNTISSIYTINNDDSITSSKLTERSFMDLDAYLVEEKSNESLKRYLDLNRLSLAFQSKIEGNIEASKQYLNAMSKSNISLFQRVLLKLPNSLLKVILNSRNYLRKHHIDLRLFR
ncbi:glycosyltransferase family 2 protein [Ichthyenterobacterium sp. W332]|uniref:Glycosyltransferase family 2 protein n=1 Tax=Microcosmobacter mediterraneus TaxID=3075607 RepID=A0ABU2YM60_9FLAO|nr:glycosyltransferase family 2 protein [Ichthyenterobacterium sp. W332]MDT0559239.1 glycosyltransferase family 2 protein [Ichthyenterobacterium sp. W332]